MKNNLISAIAGWKSAALLALVAMVAAVAFSGVLNTTQTADAQTPATTTNGGTVQFTSSESGVVEFRVLDSSSASGRFTHRTVSENGQSILCSPDAASGCDAVDADGNAQSGVQVAFKVDADSPAGYVIVAITPVGGTATTQAVTVTTAQVPASLTVTASLTSINSGQGEADAGSTTLAIRLTDTDGKGISGTSLTVITTHGTLSEVASDDSTVATWQGVSTTASDAGTAYTTGGIQVGSITTSTDADDTDTLDGAGYAAVQLQGGGVPAVATVTVRMTLGALSSESAVTMFGPADSITAEAEQSAIAVGESTFIVVKVVDSGGNPVRDQNVALTALASVVPPAKLAVPVSPALDVNKDNPPVGGDLNPLAGEIPSCGDNAAVIDATSGTPDDPTDDVPLEAASTGTDSDGRCVIQITATDNPGATPDAARGTHTINIAGFKPQGAGDVSVDIQVGGAPATIQHTAPDQIEPSSELTVSLTVFDDEDVRVGKVTIEVLHTAGDGAIIADVVGGNTTDGRASFTYIAPSTPGVVEFLVRTKNAIGAVTAQQPIIVAIGAAAEEEPEAPAATWNNELVSGQNVVVWNGADGADASEGSADGVTAIWSYNNGSGSWDGYFPEAADVPGGNTLTTLSSNQAYVVIVN